ncbi:MAG: Ig-like domain-containing protein [Nitrospirae bacterium]|nr:Ig-like domain-containing protein [Nitrospirota bacterium]
MPSAASIEVGQTQQYAAVVKDTNGNILSGVTLGWSVSHQDVATIDSQGLALGVAAGTTVVTATSGSVASQFVTLTVTAAPVPPAIGVSPTSLSFTAQAGANPAAQALTISNAGGGALSWSASDSVAWLSLSPTSGTGTGVVTASVATGTLTAGSYSGTITLSATGTPSVTIPVALTITAAPVPPAIGVSPTSLSFTAQQGGANPAAQTLTISNTGGGTLSWSVSHDATWLGHIPNTGTGTGTVTISVTTGTLTAGTYSGKVTLWPTGANSFTVPVTFTVTPASVVQLAPLPPWLTYCNNMLCANLPQVVVVVCPSGNSSCTPARSTTVVPQVNGVPVSGIALPLVHDTSLNGLPLPNTILRLISGDGVVFSGTPLFVDAYTASSVQLQSDLDFLVSYYGVLPVWSGTTVVNFTTTQLTSPLADTVFYQHPSFNTGSAASDLHTRAQTIITTERTITGITTSEHVTAYFLPTELTASRDGEGNFSYGNGTITVNYGHPLYFEALGGILNVVLPEVAHEYAHELFDEIKGAFLDNVRCLNEGIADALGFTAGFIPEQNFGPVGLRGLNFEDGCPPQTEIHDIGNCYFWAVKKAGLLTPTFMFGIYHPQHTYTFDSCAQTSLQTGNSILVYFTESANGANMLPVLDAMKIPHAESYAAAKQALGL